MSLPATLPAAILETILTRLALLFLAGAASDADKARDAAAHMLAAYHPETEDELRLAATIISFGFHALEALSQASHPDLPMTKVLRLRSGAVSLSREAGKAERRLEHLQKVRHAGIQPAPKQETTQPSNPQVEQAVALIEATRQAIETAPKTLTWTQGYHKRLAAKRIADNAKKNQAAHAAKIKAAQAAGPLVVRS